MHACFNCNAPTRLNLRGTWICLADLCAVAFGLETDAPAPPAALTQQPDPAPLPDPICVGCGKRPADLQEYVDLAADDGVAPSTFVMNDEGTYNRHNGHFACTICYVRLGCPSSPTGCVAP